MDTFSRGLSDDAGGHFPQLPQIGFLARSSEIDTGVLVAGNPP